MIANIGSISSMWPRSRNAFAFRQCPYWSRLAAGATGGWVDLGQFFAHISFMVNHDYHAFNVTPRSGNKIIRCKIFVQTGFLPQKVQQKLMYCLICSNYLHYILLVMITAHTSVQHGCQLNFSMEWPKKLSQVASRGEFLFHWLKTKRKAFFN